MVPAAAPKRAASLCLALLPLAAGHAHPHAHDHALLLLGEGQPLDGLQSELFAPWRSDACHDPTEWCWTGADGAASVTRPRAFGDSLAPVRGAGAPRRTTERHVASHSRAAAGARGATCLMAPPPGARRGDKKLLSRTSADEDGEVV